MDHHMSFKYDEPERRVMEAEQKRLQQQSPGVEVSLASAIRSLILRAARNDQQPTIRRVQ